MRLGAKSDGRRGAHRRIADDIGHARLVSLEDDHVLRRLTIFRADSVAPPSSSVSHVSTCFNQ